MDTWAGLVFERFTDYWNEGLPKLDRITFEVGQEPVVALLRLQNGEIDVPGDGIPPAKFVEVTNDPNFKDLIIRGGQLHTGYVTMNVKMAPFDKVEVRKAVNMAINKDRILRIINGRAVAANQPLPPSMPGYAKDYAGYAYDPEGAKKLLEQAGLGDGFSTELYVMNTDPQPRIAQAIQQDLKAIGITASIKSLAQANVIAAGGEENQAPMIWSGGMAWIADFPDPSNFYGPILGCGGAVPGGWNWSWYCNEELDKKAAEADAIVDPAKAAEREALWRDIYLKIMEDAPWAPIFNEERFTSARSVSAATTSCLSIRSTSPPLRSGICKRCAVTATTPSTDAITTTAGSFDPAGGNRGARIAARVQLPGLRFRSFHRRQHGCRCLDGRFHEGQSGHRSHLCRWGQAG